MNHQDKTKEELIKELQELQQENNFLKVSFEKNTIERNLAQNKFQLLFEQSPIGMALVNHETGEFLEGNNSLLKATGYSKEEFINLSYWDITPREYEAQEIKQLQALNETGHFGPNFKEYIRKDGTRYPLSISGALFIDSCGKKVVWGITEDISERKKAEEKLESNYSLLRIAGKTAKFGGWRYDVADKKILWSDEIAAMREEPLGFSPDLKSGIASYAPEYRNRISKVFEDCLELGIPYDEEMIIITAKGNNIWIRTTGEALRDDNGNIFKLQGSFQDINLKKMQEEELKLRENQLTELNATKDRLFSIIAHDLRSPFNSILGFSELLVSSIKDFEVKKSEKFAKIINSSAKNALSLVDNLLNWAKTQTGQLSIKPEKINLSIFISEVIRISNSAAEFKNINLKYVQTDAVEVYTDKDMLDTVLRNLISNAIKFTENDGRITISTKTKQKQVEVTIADNGVGINEETRKKLFDSITNSTTSGTGNEKGSGIGLVLCKEFVENQGGKIWVESEEGKGSDFKFTVPLN